MTQPGLFIYDTPEKLSAAAAASFSQIAAAAIATRGTALVALSGGGTPQAMYRLLSVAPYRLSLQWDRIHFFWGDERCVPPDDPESNYHQAWQALLAPVGVPPQNIHRARGELAPAAAAADYADQLARFGQAASDETPTAAWPHFDLVLLGLGADGHTASLFPGQVNPGESMNSVIPVTADYQGRPANRVTLTPLVFNAARTVIFLASGSSKAAALAAVLQGPPAPGRYPAQRIQPVEGMVFWMVDRDAANTLGH